MKGAQNDDDDGDDSGDLKHFLITLANDECICISLPLDERCGLPSRAFFQADSASSAV